MEDSKYCYSKAVNYLRYTHRYYVEGLNSSITIVRKPHVSYSKPHFSYSNEIMVTWFKVLNSNPDSPMHSVKSYMQGSSGNWGGPNHSDMGL